jgi:hypothetical protein
VLLQAVWLLLPVLDRLVHCKPCPASLYSLQFIDLYRVAACSVASSATQARRAEAIAARRQNLLERLARIGGSGSSKAGSTCNGASRFGGDQSSTGFGGAAGGLGAGLNPGCAENWDGSTRVGGDDVAVLTSALMALEAGEVLTENPEMRSVHSIASVRSMLQKAEAQK